MRVLIISRFCASTIYRAKIAALARRSGLEVSLLAPAQWKEGARTLICPEGIEDGYRIFTGSLIFNGRVGGHVYGSGLWRALKEARPDIVHMEEESYSFAAAQALLCLSMLRTRPKFITNNSENFDIALPLRSRKIERVVFRRADALLVFARTARERLLRLGAPAAKVRTLPQFGLDAELFRPPEPSERGDVFSVGFVGRLVYSKGVDVLLKALAGLSGEWRAQIVGDGNELGTLKQLARSIGIGERVEFLGWVDRSDVPGYLRGWHVLALPSRTTTHWREQFGRVLIEAMACGVVPVGAATGEITHVIGPVGFVFPEDNVETLRDILQKLKNEPSECKRLADAGRKRVLEEFTWDVLADKAHCLYEDILRY
ncbi:MAG: glycosyltransferase family 4 protein [Nitrospinae bacterium]|nr:glycosyltransferase family 4 protein [Nitrospinota bacterium]